MTSNTAFRGIHVPLITPLDTGGRIATDALERLARDVLDEGAAGIVALGTTAETATLDETERHAVVDVCARVCRERGATLIVGAGGNDTRRSAADLARLAAWPAVTAALVPVPYFTRPAQPGVLAHFTHLAAACPVPLIVYHVPLRTGQDLDADCLRALGRLPGVAGIKYAVGGIDPHAVELLADPPPDFAVLAGDDTFVSPLLALGATGGIVASAHLATGRYAELAGAWAGGDLPRARELGHRLSALSAAAFAGPNPTVIKGVLHAQGRIPTPDVRLPLLPAGREAIDLTLRRLAGLRPLAHGR
ncbi:dihydrodipicolinate synthase family protein [Streptosporangium sp. DT93]|uniref:dihydrodipicolinate synthase family protein n=1 Tax=Streptosporangium sp. DT93 TaxID=3393428 RepID=UPI003CF06C02